MFWCGQLAIHLTLSYTSGWVWYKGLDFHFLTPANFGVRKKYFRYYKFILKYISFFLFFKFENIIILNINPPPLILGRYAPKSNQLLISMDQNYEWNLVLIFPLVFELASPQKFGNTQTNRHFDKTVIISKNIFFLMFIY